MKDEGLLKPHALAMAATVALLSRSIRRHAQSEVTALPQEKPRRSQRRSDHTRRLGKRPEPAAQLLHLVPFGQPLKSGMECYRQVGVWTTSLKDGAGSQPIIGKSPVARWSMGPLEPAAWKAKWISTPGDVSVEPAPMFRKAFSINKKIKRAVVFVSGLGYHEMSINGRKVGDHVLDPKFTCYDRRVLYVTHEVADMLQSGPNALGVVLGNGWYNYHTKNPWEFHNAPWRVKPKLMLQLVIDFADGSTQTRRFPL